MLPISGQVAARGVELEYSNRSVGQSVTWSCPPTLSMTARRNSIRCDGSANIQCHAQAQVRSCDPGTDKPAESFRPEEGYTKGDLLWKMLLRVLSGLEGVGWTAALVAIDPQAWPKRQMARFSFGS